jgi:hypothetical protein
MILCFLLADICILITVLRTTFHYPIHIDVEIALYWKIMRKTISGYRATSLRNSHKSLIINIALPTVQRR